MTAPNGNLYFRAFDQALGTGYTRETWEQALKHHFPKIEPWLSPCDRLMTSVPCEHYGRTYCGSHRVVEHANGTYTGVCDEGRCSRRIFEKADLVPYTVNAPRLRYEVSRLIEAAPSQRPAPHEYLQPVGDLRIGDEILAVVILGGMQEDVAQRVLRSYWQDTPRKTIVLLLNDTNPKNTVKSFIERTGWLHYCIEHSFDLLPDRLRWNPGEEERWRGFLAKLTPRESVSLSDGSPFIQAIERGFSEVGRDIKRLKEENDTLKGSLADQIRAIGQEVDPEYFQWILTILAAGSVRGAADLLGMPKSTLSRKLLEYVGRGGLYAILHALTEIRSERLGARRLESYNESYAVHQGSGAADDGSEARLLREVLEALHAQDHESWPAVRDEIVELLEDQGVARS